MILQALVQYYEALLAKGKIARPGWTSAKISWGVELSPKGQLLAVHSLQTEQPKGKKMVLAPQSMKVPEQVKRSSGVAANFLCDNSSYCLGIDAKGKPARSLQCFAACRELHLKILEDVPGKVAQALCAFFESWEPEKAAECPALAQDLDEICKGGNIVFLVDGGFAQEDPDIIAAWQAFQSQSSEKDSIRCLVTGQKASFARLHPNIKGVMGAQSSGAALVSFNAPSFESYGHEQGANAPVGSYAAFAYTQALNYLIADRDHVQRAGDTTLVFWAENAEPAFQDFFNMSLFPTDAENLSESDFAAAVKKLARGEAVDWENTRLDPNSRFYILGLSPNAARLSVRFFWQNSFGKFLENVQKHYDRLEIIRPSYDKFSYLSIYWLLQETVNKNSRNAAPAPQLAGDVLRSVLNDAPYPATLRNAVNLRIRADHEVTRGRAAILKAYYTKNQNKLCPKEVLTVELNKDSKYLPYVLGRLFSVLEAVQNAANPNINTTIKDRYFNSACATPAMVFPTLINLAQKHLKKLKPNQVTYYSKQIGELMERIPCTYPAHLTLPEQGAFQIGYYHQTQERFTKKEEA